MSLKISKLLALSLVLTCLSASIYAAVPMVMSSPLPKVYVEPEENVFSTEDTSVGDAFTINISTSDWEAPGLYSYELKLYYDPALLEATDADIPDDHFMASDNTFKVKSGEIHQDEGWVWFSVTLLGDEPAKTGSGVFGYVTFTITTAPPPSLSCALELKGIILIDGDGNTLASEDYDVAHGFYEFTPPKPPLYLKVEPEIVAAETEGKLITVDITINELRIEERLTSIEWKLTYDAEFLQVRNVEEGDFLKEFAEEVKDQTGEEVGTMFFAADVPWKNYVQVGLQYYKFPAPAEVFAEGSGILATITFESQNNSNSEGVKEVDLTIFDVILLDVDLNPLMYDHLEHGKYLFPIADADLNIDGRVNILDMSIFGKNFGTYPGHPRGWFARADINADGTVNILDGVKVAKKFGKITTPKLFLKVEPEELQVSVSEEFSINITINDVEGPLKIIGVEWKLKFDTAILEVLEVVEGDFFDPPTYFWWTWEGDHILSFTLYYREPWPPEVFAEGNGTIATINFHAIAEGTSALELGDVLLRDKDNLPVMYHHLEDGTVIVG